MESIVIARLIKDIVVLLQKKKRENENEVPLSDEII